MFSKRKPIYLLRLVIIGTLIASFIYLSILFAQQYIAFEKLNQRLIAANMSTGNQSTTLYKLFTDYTEADDLFRLYTISFSKPAYQAYHNKLKEVKGTIDSLAQLPDIYRGILSGMPSLTDKMNTEHEFSLLRKTISDLILLSQDSLPALQAKQQWPISFGKQISTDTLVNRILRDTAMLQVSADTIVRKKQGLLKRIFRAERDLIVSNSITQHFNNAQIDAIYRNIDHFNNEQESRYVRRSAILKERFRALLQKEREVIQANYQLLSSFRNGIQTLKDRELAQVRRLEKDDIHAHQEGAYRFEKQLIAALAVMLFMLLLILFYQSNANNYEKRLREERTYAAKVAEEKTSILANVSHEVRTPISSLLGIIDILRKDNRSAILNKEHLDSAVQEITLINSSISDILNLSKLEVGKLEVKNDFFSPHALLSETLNLHRYQAQKKGLLLQADLSIAADLEIYGSAFRIKQITSNLLANAIKYTLKGGISLKAEIVNASAGQKLLIRVKDSGVGIALDQQQHIFRKYYMSETKTKVGGFGLGLYISSLLAQQLNGIITVESSLGKGATFLLKMPIQQTRRAKGAQKAYAIQHLPQTLRIAFIDDNEINLMYLKYHFTKLPNQVSFFTDPIQAISHIKSNSIDIVVTDMLMPSMNGWSVLSSIRENAPNVKVFLCTADTENIETYKGACTFQFDGILNKPLNEQEFVSKILETKDFKKSLK